MLGKRNKDVHEDYETNEKQQNKCKIDNKLKEIKSKFENKGKQKNIHEKQRKKNTIIVKNIKNNKK